MFAATIATAGIAQAQGYPTHPITLLVPFAAGSATDTVARLVSAKMSAQLGQPIVIENLAGAGGPIGAARVRTPRPHQFWPLCSHVEAGIRGEGRQGLSRQP